MNKCLQPRWWGWKMFALFALLLVCPIVAQQSPPGSWGEQLFESEDPQKIILGRYDPSLPLQEISVWEGIPAPFNLLKLNYLGKNAIVQSASRAGANLTEKEGHWLLGISRELDYEQDPSLALAILVFEGNFDRATSFPIRLLNVLDNSPVMTSDGPCGVDEYNELDFESDCVYTVYHPDGFQEKGILGEYTNKVEFELPEKERSMFGFALDSSDDYNKRFKLKILIELDYTQQAWYNFPVTVYDLNRTHSFTLNVVVQVNNVESRSPIFTRPFTTQRVTEKKPFSTTIAAIDGDTGLNRPICYSLKTDVEKYAKYFSIGRESGELIVAPIDRDAEENEFYEFTITAFKCDATQFNNSAEAAIILEDVNDNAPAFDVQPLELSFWENTLMELPFDYFTINDIDLGAHATYSVELSEKIDETITPSPSSFSIIPRTGYQKAQFTLTVVDPTLLDYEVEERQHFQLIVTANDGLFTNKTEIDIKLRNWNDEEPKFDNASYEISIEETIGSGIELVQVHVTDRDIDDRVNLRVLGTFGRDRDLAVTELESTVDTQYSFSIKTNKENLFDWDVAQEVVVQLEASDTLQTEEKNERLHQVLAQLIITVRDVNNKPPTITLPRGTLHIEENSVAGTAVTIGVTEAIILGRDPDSDADLEFSIDWEKSYGVKVGVEVAPKVFKDCLVFEVDKSDRNNVAGRILVNPEFNQTTINDRLDYEKYETLFLTVRLVDLNQVIPPGDTEVVVVIQIDDVNDNAPEFVGDTLTVQRSVLEASQSGVIGTIAARDIDGPKYSNITYSLEPENPDHAGWISINNQTGMLSVGEPGMINCDEPMIQGIPLVITITDGEFPVDGHITVDIIDENNKVPSFDDDEPGREIRILEKPAYGTEIVRLDVTDRDRDEPFHTVAFEIDFKTNAVLLKYFGIRRDEEQDTETGRLRQTAVVIIRDNGDELAWASGQDQYAIKVIGTDNAQSSGRRNSNDTTFTLVVLDVNDHAPEMPVHSGLRLDEDAKEGAVLVGSFRATDGDDPRTPNAWINYKVLGISAANDDDDDDSSNTNPQHSQEDIDTLFRLAQLDNYSARLEAGRDLKGFYGDWAVQIEACDRGDEYELDENGKSLCSNATYGVHVEPVNYMAPVLDFPREDERIRLRFGEQSNGQPLIDVKGEPIGNFRATDTDGGIYGEVTFSLRSQNADDQHHTYFRLNRVNQHEAQLVVPNVDAIEDKSYLVTVLATDGGNREAPPVNVVIAFINMTGDPEFPEEDSPFETDFTENEEGLSETRLIPEAIDPKNAELPPGEQKNVYYFIDKSFGNASHLFQLDERTLRLAQQLDREEVDWHEIRVIATNNVQGPTGPLPANSRAQLLVQIRVNDVNDNPPKFRSELYSAGVTAIDYVGKVLAQVVADDPDLDDVISYTIDTGSLVAQGENLPESPFPFAVERLTGRVSLSVKMTDRMKGFFTFAIVATDLVDHTDRTTVKIFIISESNRVTFVFLNKKDDLDTPEMREFLESEFSTHYGMECSIDDVYDGGNSDTGGDGRQSGILATVRAHFMRNNEAVEAVEIQQRSNDRVFVTNLKAALSTRNLFLQDVPVSAVESLEERSALLSTILIVIAAALGIVCVILLVAFCIKIRSLKRELKALSVPDDFGSVASDINGKGRKVPTTNVFSIEGSNPVLNDKEFPKGAFDEVSVQSFDSDFLGIDNDIFANNKKNELNPALLEHIRQRALNPMVYGGEDPKPATAPVLILRTDDDKESNSDNKDELSHKF